MVAYTECELQMLSRELLQVDQQIRAPLKWQTRLEAAQVASYMAVSRLSLVATSTPPDGARLPCLTAGLPVFISALEQFWKLQRWRGKRRFSPIPPCLVSPPVTSWKPSACRLFQCLGKCRVLDISKRFPAALSKHEDIGTVRIKARVVISALLPTYRRGSEVFSRLYELHCWLQSWCKNNGIGYMSNWSAFWERPAFHRRDGPHPSHRGSVILSRDVEKVLHQA
ncbi:hypothetical protein AOLI_G00262750 [Acnodon oligacanthus]